MLKGRRLVDIMHLFQSVQRICDHAPFSCSFADMVFVSERRHGLRSSFAFVCKMCNNKDVIESELPPQTTEASFSMDVNTAAVSRIISIGSGQSNLVELLASMNVPSMSSKTFAKYERTVARGIETAALESMKKAGEEEARLARGAGEIDAEGCPLVTVIADGAWSKRSYKNKRPVTSWRP
ncbi:unnamed protein product [Ixodes pacificus]